MQTVFEKVRVDALIARSNTAKKALASMNSIDAQDRNTTLSAVEALVVQYIMPAMVDCPLSSASLDVFDLEAVAGTEVRGLILGLFEDRMNELKTPSDETLNEALAYIEVPIANQTERNRFYRCWAAEQATITVLGLLNFLKEPLIKPLSLQHDFAGEQTRLGKLLENDLPGELQISINSLVDQLKSNG